MALTRDDQNKVFQNFREFRAQTSQNYGFVT